MQRGFTLIELLVVIAIIGILSAVIIGGFSGSQAQARDNARQSDLKNLQLAIERFRADEGEFPDTLSDLIPVYTSSIPDDDWDIDYQTTSNNDRYILAIEGVESILTDAEHKFACPDSTSSLPGPCSGTAGDPDDVYAVYSEGALAW